MEMTYWITVSLIALVIYILVWVFTLLIVSRAAYDKGYADIRGMLWVIGFLGSPFLPAIIVAALPDRNPYNSQAANVYQQGAGSYPQQASTYYPQSTVPFPQNTGSLSQDATPSPQATGPIATNAEEPPSAQ